MTTVTMSPRSSPTYRVGPKSGFKNDSLIETPDLHVTDDLLVDGDMEVTGTIYGTLVGGVTTATNHLTAAIVVDASSHLTAAAGATNIDYTLSTGTFGTPTGTNHLNGDVTVATGKTFTQVGTGTFTTGTGAVGLNGHVTLAAAKNLIMSGASTVTTGTGAIALNGEVTVAADKAILMQGTGAFTTGSGAVTLAGATGVSDHLTIAANKNLVMGTAGSGTGTIQTGTGDITLNGNVAQTSTKTFGTGTGAVSLNGHVTIAAAKDLIMTTTGAFTSGTGAIALKGDTTISTTKTLAVTDADKLTVGGIIVPQYTIINVPFNAASVDQWTFVADAGYMLDSVELIFTVTSSSGAIDIKKSTSVQAPASGATMLTGTGSLAGTANTVTALTPHGTGGNKSLADGNTMSVCYTGTMTGLVGGILTIRMKRT